MSAATSPDESRLPAGSSADAVLTKARYLVKSRFRALVMGKTRNGRP